MTTIAIHARTCYAAVCASCHCSPAMSAPAFTSDDAREVAERAGWLVTRTGARCPGCQDDSDHDEVIDAWVARRERELDLIDVIGLSA